MLDLPVCNAERVCFSEHRHWDVVMERLLQQLPTAILYFKTKLYISEIKSTTYNSYIKMNFSHSQKYFERYIENVFYISTKDGICCFCNWQSVFLRINGPCGLTSHITKALHFDEKRKIQSSFKLDLWSPDMLLMRVCVCTCLWAYISVSALAIQ